MKLITCLLIPLTLQGMQHDSSKTIIKITRSFAINPSTKVEVDVQCDKIKLIPEMKESETVSDQLSLALNSLSTLVGKAPVKKCWLRIVGRIEFEKEVEPPYAVTYDKEIDRLLIYSKHDLENTGIVLKELTIFLPPEMNRQVAQIK